MEQKHLYPSLQKLAIAKIAQNFKSPNFFLGGGRCFGVKGCDIENVANSSKKLVKLIDFTLIFSQKVILSAFFLEKKKKKKKIFLEKTH